jgi:hypothetical protein
MVLLETRGARMGARRATVIIAVCAALAITGCGGGAKQKVASLAKASSSSSDSSSSSGDGKAFGDALVDYTRCLRDHGLDVPDPTYNSDGGSAGNGQLNTANGPGVGGGAVIAGPGGSVALPSPDDPAFQAADKECKPILDAAAQDLPKPSPEEQAKARDQALAFAQCMREHGIDMPDPTFTDDGGISIAVPSDAAPSGDPRDATVPQAFQDASKACSQANGMFGSGPGIVTSGNGDASKDASS